MFICREKVPVCICKLVEVLSSQKAWVLTQSQIHNLQIPKSQKDWVSNLQISEVPYLSLQFCGFSELICGPPIFMNFVASFWHLLCSLYSYLCSPVACNKLVRIYSTCLTGMDSLGHRHFLCCHWMKLFEPVPAVCCIYCTHWSHKIDYLSLNSA